MAGHARGQQEHIAPWHVFAEWEDPGARERSKTRSTPSARPQDMLKESWIPVPPEGDEASAAPPPPAFDPAAIEYTVGPVWEPLDQGLAVSSMVHATAW